MGLSRDWVGGKNIVYASLVVIPYGEEPDISKIPPKIPAGKAKR